VQYHCNGGLRLARKFLLHPPPHTAHNPNHWQIPAEDPSLTLERQIIAADCQVLEAVLSFLRQDWGSYMKGAWVLRRAWKTYQRVYAKLRTLYMRDLREKAKGESNRMTSTSCVFDSIPAPPPPVAGGAADSSPTADPEERSRQLHHAKAAPGDRATRQAGVSHSLSVPFGLLSLVRPSTSSPPSSSAASSEEGSPAGGSPGW